MGQVIQMPAVSKNNQSINRKIGKKTKQQKAAQKHQQGNIDNALVKTSAKILFFTGVRYERLEQCVSIPANIN